MIFFEIDGVEFQAEVVTEAKFEEDFYDEAILQGAGFTHPVTGERFVVLAPKATVAA